MEVFCRGFAHKSSLLGNRNKTAVLRSSFTAVHQCNFSTVSSSASTEAVARGTTRRLYRILQRQCVEVAKALPPHDACVGETMLLFQPMLNPMQSGNHRVFPIKTATPEDDVQHLLALFRDWNEDNGDSDDAHTWYRAIHGSSYSEDDASSGEDLDWDALEPYFTDEPTLWTIVSSIQKTIRHAFRAKLPPSADGGDVLNPKMRRLMNKYTIAAVRLLVEQQDIGRLTSVSYENDIRVVATSKHIGSSHMGPRKTAEIKNRFNYRIRIENLSDQETVQLLGRYWQIQELESTSEGEEDIKVGDPIIVDAPNSGAGKEVDVSELDWDCRFAVANIVLIVCITVGQLPVLRPGEAFEYMSGCELGTARGVMQGSFYLAKVPLDTPSATLNTSVAAFKSPDRFDIGVKPFPLEATAALADSSK